MINVSIGRKPVQKKDGCFMLAVQYGALFLLLAFLFVQYIIARAIGS